MPQRVQTLRSSVKTQRPSSGTREPGELYVNFPDLQFGMINAGKVAQDLLPVRYFSASADYVTGDFVVYNAKVYKARGAITAGAFNPAQWDALTVTGEAEPPISLGTTSQYWRGDKTWQTLDKSAVGLSNVDNTSDINKPVSTAQAAADALKANIASPTFTGDPKAPTPAPGDSDTSIATTNFVSVAIGNRPLDAPVDGKYYGRKDGGWSKVTEEAASDSITYGRKNGAWSAVVGGAVISDTPPPGPLTPGQLWWESDTGNTFLWFDDGDTTQWVQQNIQPAGGGSSWAGQFLPFSTNATVSGLSFTQADLGFGVRGTSFVFNTKPDFTGTDVLTVTESGTVTASYIIVGTVDGSSVGNGVRLLKRGTGFSEVIGFLDGAGALRGQMGLNPTHGFYVRAGDVTTDDLVVDASGNLTAAGDIQSASTVFKGTTQAILGCTTAGTVYLRPTYNSATNQTTLDTNGNMVINGDCSPAGSLVATGHVVSTQYIRGATTSTIFANTTSGTIYFRPVGYSSGTGQCAIGNTGDLTVAQDIAFTGICGSNALATNSVKANHQCKNGVSISGGGYGAQLFNMLWTGTFMTLFADNTNLGQIGGTSDYRIKKDIEPLPSMWEQVKALKPIKYTQAEFQTVMSAETAQTVARQKAEKAARDAEILKASPDAILRQEEEPRGPLFVADDIERWGFIAHEAQETLVPTAASGEKDMEDGVQGLNLAPILAATVKALQEAMARIEALEGAAS